MFEIVFLGTSASAPSVQRGLSSAIVMAQEHRFMIDCGEGTQRQILRGGLGFRRLDKILLTHGHLDHILGLGGLASTLGRWETLEELNIFGGEAALARVHTLMEVVFGPGQIPHIVSLALLEEGLIFTGKNFSLTAFPVIHRGSGCFGFTFTEETRRPFLAEKAEALGIPHGPIRRDLIARRDNYAGRWARDSAGSGAGRSAAWGQTLLHRRCGAHGTTAQSGCRCRSAGN